MKKNLFLRLCLILVVGFSAFSCRTDQFPEAETFNNGAKFQLTSKRISLDESKHKAKLLPELEKAEAKFKAFSNTNAQGKIVNYGNGVSIDTESVIYIENGPNYHTYTFHITKANDPADAPVENLVLTPLPDGTYKELLVTYNLTPAEKLQAENGVAINTHGKVQITELEKGTYNNGNLQGKEITGITCGWTEEAQFTTCSDNVHSNGELPTEMGGTCHAAITSQYYTVAVYKCDWIYGEGNPFNAAGPGESIDNPVGTPGGGGGSTSGSCSENGVFTAPIDPTTNINMECGNGVVTQITVPVKPNITTPCARVKKTINDTDYKANLLDLQGKTNLDYEVAYTVSDPPANSNEPRNKYFTGSVNARSVEIHITQYLRSAMHTHYKNLHPVFSPKDISNFSEWLKAIKDYNAHPALAPAEKIDLKTLTATVVTPIGNYLIIFDGTDFVPLPTYTEEELKKLANDYNEKLDATLTSVVPQKVYNVEKFETEFLKFLRDKMPLNGLKLYKVESTGNTEIYLENDTKKPNPCPTI
ncbi:hypothetical protein BA768_14415 [Chryseobacterium sp. CBo1]|uniref:hypothetical protein n=1 Tax=Chryseobacterium sp. CBo1 TaxID=1869230 RepID=UPI0008104B78|nr:hypothetical protein [Chryseobacterium sp. CBo1]OCK51915.1 hypothetical protein BA768_14415 [Chryseobacterium sp. CBo1]